MRGWEDLGKHVLIALDIETSNGHGSGSLEPRDPDSVVALIQLAYPDGTIEVLRPSDGVISRIKKMIDDDYRFIIHNAAFELDWFRVKYGIEFKDVWCTMLASQVLNAGKTIPDEASRNTARMQTKNLSHLGEWDVLIEEDEDFLVERGKGRFDHTLQSVVYRYGNGAVIQKDQGNSNWLQQLTAEQRRYAEDDVRYLHEVYHNQVKFINKLGLDRVAALEMRVLIPVTKMRHIGILVEREKWLKEALRYGEQAVELEVDLNQKFGLELAKKEGELSLFGDYVPRAFKVSSPTQLKNFFGLEKADESVLRTVSHPLVPRLLQYKEYQKISSTYGEKYLSHIREDDGRIHTSLVQAETATGRFSSRNPNLQNIPSEMLKSFLRSDPGKLIVTFDYSAVESRILAYASHDDGFIHSVNSQDVHWETAKKIFHLPENAQRRDVFTVENKQVSGDELRRRAKGTNFGIPYGISAVGLVNRGFAEDKSEGQALIDNYFLQYPKVDKYLKASVGDALMKGYTQNHYGRIRWYQIPETNDPDVLKMARGSAARQGQNHGIQSTSADITKRAIADVHDYLLESGNGDIILTVHDSIITELNIDTVGESVYNILNLMEAAGPIIVPGIVTPVDADVGYKETRKCDLTGLSFKVFTHYYDEKTREVHETPDIYEPRVAKIVSKVDGDRLAALKEYVFNQDKDWRKDNQDLVEVVQAL